MKHTPGPWEVERRTGKPDHWQINGVNQDLGCQWRGLAMIYTSGSWADDPEGLANAHLIAAAPDMLEALEDIVDQGIMVKNHRFSLDLIENAIRKAKGQS